MGGRSTTTTVSRVHIKTQRGEEGTELSLTAPPADCSERRPSLQQVLQRLDLRRLRHFQILVHVNAIKV